MRVVATFWIAGFCSSVTSLSTYPLLTLGSHFQVMWLTHRDKVKFRKERSPKCSLTEVSQSCERRWHRDFDSEFWDPGRKGMTVKKKKVGLADGESPALRKGRNVAFSCTWSPTRALRFLENDSKSQKAPGKAGLDYSVIKWQRAHFRMVWWVILWGLLL